MVDIANQIWRDYSIDGIPSSGVHWPIKSKIREWGTNLELTLITILSQSFADGAVGDNVHDDTAAFAAAAASGKTVYIPTPSVAWKISGTITFANGTRFIFSPLAVVNQTLSGTTKGFYVPTGVKNAGVTFNGATINVSSTSNNPSGFGGYNGFVTIGDFFYAATPDSPVLDIEIRGPVKLFVNGAINVHVVDIYGFARRILVDGGDLSGQTNFAVQAHWGYKNASNTEGVFPPNGTYHPDGLRFENLSVINRAGGTVARAFSVSACRRVTFKNCVAIDCTTLGFNLFSGDYGDQYAADTGWEDTGKMMQYHFDTGCSVTLSAGAGLSVDGQTTGVNGSAIWTGTDNGARLTGSLKIIVKAGATAVTAFAISLLETVDLKLDVVEEGTTNASQSSIFGIKNCNITGNIHARIGVLIRACKALNFDSVVSTPLEEPESAYRGLSLSSSVVTGVTDAAVYAIGATTVNLVSMASALITGAGGMLEYNGMRVHIRKSTTTNIGAQSLTIDPLPSAIPASAAVNIIQTNIDVKINDKAITGFSSALRVTGSGVAKIERLALTRTLIERCGIYDLDIDYVRRLEIMATRHRNSGLRTSITTNRGISVGANVDDYLIIGPSFTNARLNYPVYFTPGCAGFSDAISSDSINAAATNPALILRSSPNQRLGNNNKNGTGVKMVHQSGTFLNVIASDTVTVFDTLNIIDTEAAAATDNLATINGGYPGQIIVLRTASSSRDVTVKDGTGNIDLAGGDRVLDTNTDTLTLVSHDGASWLELAFANNS